LPPGMMGHQRGRTTVALPTFDIVVGSFGITEAKSGMGAGSTPYVDLTVSEDLPPKFEVLNVTPNLRNLGHLVWTLRLSEPTSFRITADDLSHQPNDRAVFFLGIVLSAAVTTLVGSITVLAHLVTERG
jgi:hypothetical protein